MKLSSLCSVITKGTTPTTLGYEFTQEGINFVKIENITQDSKIVQDRLSFISTECNEKLKRSQLMEGDILFSIAGAIGRCAIVEEDILPANTNQALAIIRLRDDICVNRDYLLSYLKSSYVTNQYSKMTQGVAQLNISLTNIGDFDVYLPPLPIQQKIANILDRTSNLIEKRKAQIAKLDLLVKSQFIEMFGDPMTNPKGWKKESLGRTCIITTGNTPPRANIEFYGNFIEWIKTDNIQSSDSTLTQASEYLSEKGLERGRFVEANSILMTCIAGSLKSIGNVAVTDRRVAFNQQINALTPRAYSSLFLYYLLKLMKAEVHGSVNMMLKGILSKGTLSEIKAIVPPTDLQNRFAEFVQATDKSKSKIQRSLDSLELLRKSLMQQYFC